MYHETSLSRPSPSDDNDGITTARNLLLAVLDGWNLPKKVRKKVREYIEKTDVAIALSKLNEGVKNIIEEYLNGTQFDEKKYQKNINKASNIVDNWEDSFPVRRSKIEAYLKKELELNDEEFSYLKDILIILKYLTVTRMFNREIQL